MLKFEEPDPFKATLEGWSTSSQVATGKDHAYERTSGSIGHTLRIHSKSNGHDAETTLTTYVGRFDEIENLNRVAQAFEELDIPDSDARLAQARRKAFDPRD